MMNPNAKYQSNQRVLHAALLQQTNQALLDIRNAELSYYSSFYLTFGGQAALVGGFVYGALTQIEFPVNDQYDHEKFMYIKRAFWLWYE